MLVWLKCIVAFLQPPGLNILLLLLGLFFWLISKKGRAAFLLISSTLLLYLFSIPLANNVLIGYLEKKYQSKFEEIIKDKTPQAIVVLSAGKWPNSNALLRNLYAAKLAKNTNLPILVSGGGANRTSNDVSEAADMAKSLAADCGISGAIWVEGDSHNTMESAKFTKKVLEKNNINNVFLVTNAWHMSRAMGVFSKQGIKAIPAPIVSNIGDNKFTVDNLTPSAEGVVNSEVFFHEYFGALWYKVLELVGS